MCGGGFSIIDQLWRFISAVGPGLWPKKREDEANRVVIESRQLEGLSGCSRILEVDRLVSASGKSQKQISGVDLRIGELEAEFVFYKARFVRAMTCQGRLGLHKGRSRGSHSGLLCYARRLIRKAMLRNEMSRYEEVV
ncbi:hypothetical protein VTL71DRAFT_16059 [Oculimacula yallundae]|uniref:Uncharacterized protein n=1 Tax=Oculimacula yallundae TaxID=86028 RepID=A0ABR4CDD5_9HELO